MMPTIQSGTVLVINRLAYGFKPPLYKKYLCRWALPDKGNVIVFYTPAGDLAVKRCAEVLSDKRFVALGDNSLESYDSRSYGPVPLDNILGRVIGMNLLRPEGRGIVKALNYLRGGSFRKEIYNIGESTTKFLLVLLTRTALKGGVLNPKAE